MIKKYDSLLKLTQFLMIFHGENWYSICYLQIIGLNLLLQMSDGLVILSTDWFVGEIRKRRGPSPVISSPSPVSASELPRIQLWRLGGKATRSCYIRS